MRRGGESKGTVVGFLGVIVFVVMGGGEVDAGAALEGGEESGDEGGADAARRLIDPLHGSGCGYVGVDRGAADYAGGFIHGLPIRLKVFGRRKIGGEGSRRFDFGLIFGDLKWQCTPHLTG